MTLKCLKHKDLDGEPRTIGEHIKRKRLREGLTQQAAGVLMGVSAFTVLNWEKGRATPSPQDFPRIIRFLGYAPLPEPVTLPERLRYIRCMQGWSIKDAGRAAGIHEETWGYWESGANEPQRRMKERIERFLASMVGV